MKSPSQISPTFFDTDMHLFRFYPESPTRHAAEKEFSQSSPTAMASFTLVEIKGNYIQSLKLLSKKVAQSDSAGELWEKIDRSQYRRLKLLFMHVFIILSKTNTPLSNWAEAKGFILTYLDAQIAGTWIEIKGFVDTIVDDLNCDRAKEGPESDNAGWNVRIPKCNNSNTNCYVVEFLDKFNMELEKLESALSLLSAGNLTKELNSIRTVILKAKENGSFPWEGTTCRGIGDLLIGLQSRNGKELVSSNYKEHNHLHGPLGYNYRRFVKP